MPESRPRMKALVFGGAGFVGLNIAQHLLSSGVDVVVYDRLPLLGAAASALAGLPGKVQVVEGDVGDSASVARALVGVSAVVLGAAITADAAREAREPEKILEVNLGSLVPILRAGRDAGVQRFVNLSSAAAYGLSAVGDGALGEETPAQPTGLYGITKLTSEMVGARMAALWSLDFVSLRLSGVFGPWERATGVRDTTSPHYQITEAVRCKTPALLARPGLRDWLYAPDVAEAVLAVLRAPALKHRVYNVSAPWRWSVLDWGRQMAALHPGFDCRLAAPDEAPTIDLHGASDRASLSVTRLDEELGWKARFDMAASARHLDDWRRSTQQSPERTPCD